MSPNLATLTCLPLILPTQSFTPPQRFIHSLKSTTLHNNKPSWQENAEYWAHQEQLRLQQSHAKPTKPARNQTPAPGIGDSIGGTPVDRSPWDEGGNTFAHLYQPKSTDEFKLPFHEQEDIVTRMQRNSQANKGEVSYRRDVTENGSVPEWFGQGAALSGGEKTLKSAQDVLGALNGSSHTAPPRNQLQGSTTKASTNPYGEGTKRHSFQMTSRDEFRRPYDESNNKDAAVPEWFGSNERILNKPPVNGAEILPSSRKNNHNNVMPMPVNPQVNPYGEEGKRHSFQMSSTDDFRKPHGSITPQQSSQSAAQSSTSPPTKQITKSPFQTSTTDSFRRPSDTATSSTAPQQPMYAEFTKTKSNTWKNSVGLDTYESTLLPGNKSRDSGRGQEGYATNPSQSSAILTPEPIGKSSTKRRSGGNNMLLRSIQWNDPPLTPQHPQLFQRISVTIASTILTRYLHLWNGYSPVLACSMVSFLVSTCYDKRLGSAALCGAMVGMSGGHLLPSFSMGVLAGGISSLSYEVLTRNSLGGGLGGQIGSAAFVATSIMAKYQRIQGVGRKLRRGMWKAGVGPSSIVVSMIVFHILGSLTTILLRCASEEEGASDPVKASSVVGIVGSLLIHDPTALMALYGGSLVGMSFPSRLIEGHLSRIRQNAGAVVGSFAGAGALAGLIHAMATHYGYWNGGWGGKAGLCAFAGCWVYRGLDNILRFNKNR